MRSLSLACALAFSSVGTALADVGHDTAKAMQAFYASTPASCGPAPAFVCSGILLRTTRPSPSYHTWDHSPNSREKGGVAFSYLRADAPISRLAEGASSGYTLAPRRLRPEGTLGYRVLCAYPTDGDSWTRNAAGCGDNSQTEAVEQFCHEQGVFTAEDWIARYRATPGPEAQRYFAQCAFDVDRERGEEAAKAFHESLRAMTLMPDRPFPWNEVMLRAWKETRSQELPIQSFFYIPGQWNGLQNAQFDQRDWHETTGKFVPIIEITLPGNNVEARFVYREEDQAIKAPH
jgi:hypothetical protein